MNSSFAPFGPRVRNSLITTDEVGDGLGDGFGDGDGVGTGDGMGVGEGLTTGVGLGVDDGRGEGEGEGEGVGVEAITDTVDAFDCMPRAIANTSARPAPTAFARPFSSTSTTPAALVIHLKITSLNS